MQDFDKDDLFQRGRSGEAAKLHKRKRLNHRYVSQYCYVVGLKSNIPKQFQNYETCPDELWNEYESKVEKFLQQFHQEKQEYKKHHGHDPIYYTIVPGVQVKEIPTGDGGGFLKPLTSSTPFSWTGYDQKCYNTPPRSF